MKIFKRSVSNIDPQNKLFLFGSRVNDHAKGGDIDLAILSDTVTMEDEWKILNHFEEEFEEEKIDIQSQRLTLRNPAAKYILIWSITILLLI